jgi:hypothetical protein
MESFSESKNLARVMAGMKGGPFFKSPMQPQKMTFVEGYPSEYAQKIKAESTPKQTVEDPWVMRRSNANGK